MPKKPKMKSFAEYEATKHNTEFAKEFSSMNKGKGKKQQNNNDTMSAE